MRKGLKRNSCKSASHQLFKDKAKNRVDDLQMIFSDLQSARKDSRTLDAAVLEEQVYLMLREWKSELNEPSPASSVQNDSLGTFSSDIYRLLHLCDEEDDATSPFELPLPKSEPDVQKFQAGDAIGYQEGPEVKPGSLEQNFSPVDQCKGSPGFRSLTTNMEMANQLDYNQFNLHVDLEHHYLSGYNGVDVSALYAHPISGFLPNVCPPPAAFLGPKCALWDCPRPAQGSDWWLDYCSSFHATLALNEGPPGMSPVLRPGGIGLKDGLLFAALSAKAQGKDVGIPECEGAATAKSPWNAPELFDLSVLEGETIREWLFFDKPRRAFESGNRKQRSLPDYSGRGWHESRKQVMDEFSGLKRSYYMDPQPLNNYEWHLYEYEINKCDVCALYRLELKLVDRKKTPRGKTANDTVSELQKQMGRLTAEFPLDNRRPLKGRAKFNSKDGVGNLRSDPNQLISGDKTFDHGVGPPYGYLVENIGDYYLK
ncbi:transcription factor VOZ1-like [Chenopodium quinoa]|uniref:transcription factor VOZ1-like n=1 Tax=Chenopodium quinoa TaxID=63459 RepID=UPI000B76E94C|nr:transcription factor VOZ1-like [Chenopodium quinoa]XP_021766000.1 transcription factor VOZ1-like [Chenopodium quinoa]